MNISVVDYNLAMTRPQDLAIQKYNEDHQGVVNQSVFQSEVDKKNAEKASQVNGTTDVDTRQSQKDAAEGGSNEYSGDGGARRRQARARQEETQSKADEIPVEGRVIRKKISDFHADV